MGTAPYNCGFHLNMKKLRAESAKMTWFTTAIKLCITSEAIYLFGGWNLNLTSYLTFIDIELHMNSWDRKKMQNVEY